MCGDTVFKKESVTVYIQTSAANSMKFARVCYDYLKELARNWLVRAD
jgi:Fe-S cluster assembly iron-binding protein IscA